jgi:hypothetical protein
MKTEAWARGADLSEEMMVTFLTTVPSSTTLGLSAFPLARRLTTTADDAQNQMISRFLIP